MGKSKYNHLFGLVFVIITTGIGFGVSSTEDSQTGNKIPDFAAFQKAFETSDDSQSISLGDSIFSELEKKYKGNLGLDTIKSKLTAAEFLAGQMESQLSKMTRKLMLTVPGELFNTKKKGGESKLLLIAPAKSFYETSVVIFSKPPIVDKLGSDEKKFLAQYYNLKLRILTSAIAKAGQALSVTEPTFKGTHDYVLVLPLLHHSDKNSFNIDVLPRWMQQPEQLDIFSDSCLLHFGFSSYAMMIAKKAAQLKNEPFSEIDFYKTAAKKCWKSYPNIAAECLRRAIDSAPNQETETVVTLRFELVQLWLDSENYALAAGEARKIFEAWPNHKDSSKAIWFYYYALSKGDNTDQVLTDIDNVLADKRCDVYKAKLMYIKWRALRRKQSEQTRIEALEYQLLKEYGDDPIVAPVLLARATDFLAKQDYNEAYRLLEQLSQKFPSTKAALQAKKLVTKLKATKETQ